MVTKTEDLYDVFIDKLNRRVPKKADLVALISALLNLERESTYRRISGKVNFSIREMGIIAKALDISIDNLLYESDNEDFQWLPFILESPMKRHSMDSLCDRVELNLNKIEEINCEEPGEAGNVYNSLPLEFFVNSPMMMRFMFFKWGNYFIQSEEFNKFSDWKLPTRLAEIHKRYNRIYNFREIFYIWDSSLIWTLVREIDNFYTMKIITAAEKNEIKNELKDLMSKLEQTLNGTYSPKVPIPQEMAFYVSSVNVGFVSGYFASRNKYLAMLQTNFSFCVINNSIESFEHIKEWVKSFRNISCLLSSSGRVERRSFFEAQQKIIDQIL